MSLHIEQKKLNPHEPLVSVVIPAYCEEKRIASTLRDLHRYFQEQIYPYEIIVVNDGSTDQTETVVRQLRSEIKNLYLHSYPQNQGKGYAVRRGMEQARGHYLLFMDADNSVRIDNLEKFINTAQLGYDVVIASIDLPDAQVVEHNQWYRRWLSNLSKGVIHTFAVPDIHDTQRGFKLFTRQAAEIVFSYQTIHRFGFDIELLAIARLHGLFIKELPVRWDNPEGSTVKPSAYLTTLKELLVIKNNMWHGRYTKKQ